MHSQLPLSSHFTLRDVTRRTLVSNAVSKELTQNSGMSCL